MPPIVATSSIARAISSARSLIAASPVWIARQATYGVGVSNPIDRIYGYEAHSQSLASSLPALRPLAVVESGEDTNYTPHQTECLMPALLLAGGIYVLITDNARYTDLTTYDYNDSYIDFVNFCHGVCDDMDGRFGDPVLDLIGFRSIETVDPPHRTDIKQRQNDDCWAACFRFQFGDLQ